MIEVRQNYHEDCEKGINEQLNLYHYAAHTALSIAWYLERGDVALPSESASAQSDFYVKMASRTARYQNLRGGRIILNAIAKPERDEWGSLLDASEALLALAKRVNEAALNLHKVASTHDDYHLEHEVKEHHLVPLANYILAISKDNTNLRRTGPGHGEFDAGQSLTAHKALS